MSNEYRGAKPADWYHFDFELGLSRNLLPCVPAGPDVQISAGSALMGKLGKIPSAFNSRNEAHGLEKWQSRVIHDNELALWRKDPRLNICVRTGPISGVYAIDVDIDADMPAGVVDRDIHHVLEEFGITQFAERRRPNSAKFLLPFRMEGACKKRIIETNNGRIELLADGQQFVAAGSHSSGVRYVWQPGLPADFPTLTLDQLNHLWSQLTTDYAITDGHSQSASTKVISSPSKESPTHEALISSCTDDDWNRIISALRALVPYAGDNDTWSEIGYALLSLQRTRPVDRLFVDFSKLAPNYTDGAPQAWWEQHKAQATRTDFRHIFTLARKLANWGVISKASDFPPIEDTPAAGGDGDGAAPADDQPADVQPQKRVIRVTEASLEDNLKDMTDVMRDSAVYVQGNVMMQMTEPYEDELVRRDSDVRLVQTNTVLAQLAFCNVAIFVKFDGRKKDWKIVNAPDDLVGKWLSRRSWPGMKPLDAIARAPFVREDGSICDEPGYDRRGRALYLQTVRFPPIPESPTQANALTALGRIRSIFREFPWQTPAAESAFLAHLLTEAARLALDTSPAFWYTAQYAGTGKGLLAEMPALIVHGATPPRRTWTSESEEMRKVLFAQLLNGDRSIMFDNLPDGHKARSAELCAFLTADTWSDRKLGASEIHTLTNKAVVVATGNNINPVSDLSRRSMVVRLDANTPRLDQRRFEIRDLKGYVREHRGELLVAALTIIKAFHAAEGVGEMPVPLPTFERWSHFCRNPLIWLGMPDPCSTKVETDDETGSVANAIDTLALHFRGVEFTAVDIARVAGGLTDQTGELTNVMLAAGCNEPSSPLKVGYWLRGARDKFNTAGTLKLVKSGEGRIGMKWKLLEVT